MILNTKQLDGLGGPLTIRHGDATITHIDGIGDSSAGAPSRLTWFVVGAATAFFAKPLIGIVEGILGLGHAGLRRAHRKVEG